MVATSALEGAPSFKLKNMFPDRKNFTDEEMAEELQIEVFAGDDE